MPFKKIKRAFKKITKPVAKVLNKVVPNEIKPFLPYAAAVAPYLLPAGTAGAGLLGTMKGRAFLTGGLNLASQLAQEGAEEGDFSALSLGLAGLQGALTAPGAADTLRGFTRVGTAPDGSAITAADASAAMEASGTGIGQFVTPDIFDAIDPGVISGQSIPFQGPPSITQLGLGAENISKLDKAVNVGLRGLAKGAEAIDTVMSAGKADPFSMAGLKAASIPFTQGSIDLGMATARKALQDYEAELAAFNAQAGADQAASDADRRAAIIASMTRADFTQDIIDETLGQLGLKDGGRVGFSEGGFEPFKFTSEVPKVFKEDAFGDDALGEIMKMSYAVKAPIIDIVRIVAKTGAEAAKLTAAIAKLGYDVTEPIRDLTGSGLKMAAEGIMEAFKDSKTGTRYIQPMYYATRFGPEKNLTDEEAQLEMMKYSVGRDDPKKRRELENIVFGFDDAGMNQRPEDKEISEKIKLRERLNFDNGGDVSFGGITEAVKNVAKKPKKFLVDELEVTVQPGQSEKMAIVNAMFNDVDDVMPEDRKAEFYRLYLPQLRDSGEISKNDYESLVEELQLNKKDGGIASLKDGGIMDLGGKEMDMRGGGFIPIGAKERADDVPARLSKNEFVMTADAVRAAGGGSVNKGAKRMYDLMHNLEARA